MPDQLSHPRSPLPWERGSGSSHSSIVPDEEPRVTGAVQPPVVNPVPKQSGIVVTPAEHQNARPAHRQTARSFSNDPSAGSPTKTLLRLLVPTNREIQLIFSHGLTPRWSIKFIPLFSRYERRAVCTKGRDEANTT